MSAGSPPTPPAGATSPPGNSVIVRIKRHSDFTDYRTIAQCLQIPLKSGGTLNLRWNHFPAMDWTDAMGVEPDAWQPGGRGGMFSVMPFLFLTTNPATNTYHRMAEEGPGLYSDLGGVGSVRYFEIPGTPYKARRNSLQTYFTEYNTETQVYFQYGAENHALFGRPLRQWDRNGNQLTFSYSARTSNPSNFNPLPRKITGDLANVIPYFEYGGSTNEASRPAPVKKVFLMDRTGAAAHRTVYFDYTSYTDPAQTYLTKITYPGGCVRQFQFVDASNRTAIQKEMDPDGFTTYFQYGSGLFPNAILRKAFEPGGKTTYFVYATTQKTQEVPSGKASTYYEYQLRTDTSAPKVRRVTDALGNQTYYTYDSGDRVLRMKQANGSTTYYEYNAQEEVTKYTRAFDGAVTQYTYPANGVDIHSMVGPRNAGGFPVVTYYEYDGSRNRVAQTDALGNKTQSKLDTTSGRILKSQDANLKTTYFNYRAPSYFLYAQQDPTGNITYFGYDAYGSQKRFVSSRWKETGSYANFSAYYGYDQLNRRKKIVDAQGKTTYYDYTSRGDLADMVDARGVETAYTYNGLRLLTKSSVLDIAGTPVQTQYFAYDTYSNLTRQRDANGNWTYLFYDALNRQRATRDAQGNLSYFFYDSLSNQTKQQDARQNTTYHFYDTLSRRKAMRDALGNLTYFFFDLADNQTKDRDARLNTTYHFYDALDRERATRDALGNQTYFFFDAVGNRSKTRDARLNASYFFYDALNRRKATRDAQGNLTYFAYDATGNRRRVRDPRLNTTYYAYDTLDRRKLTRDALGNQTYFAYDVVGNLTREQDARPNTTYHFYDALSRRKATRDALTNHTYFFFDAVGNQTKVRDARLNTNYFFYDTLNRQKATRDALANLLYFFYDAVGNRRKARDARQNTIYYSFDALNRQSGVLDPLGNISNTFYDAVGNQTIVKDVRGNSAYFFYDRLDRQKATRDALTNLTYFFYDSLGNSLATRDARGNDSGTGYDALNRVVRTAGRIVGYGLQAYGTTAYGGGPAEVVTYFVYDAVGNWTKTISPRGFTTYFDYDAVNRLRGMRDAVGGTQYFGYDGVGNTIRQQDALLRTTYFAYDAVNRQTVITDALSQTVSFGYDAVSNRRKEQDARGNTTYYAYDALNRLSGVTDPLAAASSYAYDPNFNLLKTVDNNGTVNYFAYDALDRRTRILYPAETQYFEYDAGANLTRMLDGWGTSNFAYDVLNRVSKRTTPRGDNVYYGYDAVSNLIKLRYPQGTAACYYRYDNLNRMDKLLSPEIHAAYYAYDAGSNVIKNRFGNNTVVYYVYDNADQVTKIRHVKSDGMAIVYFDYGRDVSGRITKIGRETDLVIYYGYDAVDRLTKEEWHKKSTGSQIYAFTYSYDAASNRLKMRREAAAGVETESAYYTYDAANALKKRRVEPGQVMTYYTYDLNGSLVKQIESGDTTYFAYGPHGFAVRIKPPSDAATYFYYDGRLNRHKMGKLASISYFLWEGPNLLEERDPAGTLKARHTHGYVLIQGIGSTVETQRLTATTTYYQYLHMDTRGTVYGVTNPSQDVQITYVQDAFGRTLAAAGGTSPNVPNDLRYQTNWRSILVGGNLYGVSQSRVYDFSLGRFLGRDPSGYRHAVNLYVYAAANPILFYDAFGADAHRAGARKSTEDAHKIGAARQADEEAKAAEKQLQMERQKAAKLEAKGELPRAQQRKLDAAAAAERRTAVRKALQNPSKYPPTVPGAPEPKTPKKTSGAVHTKLVSTVALCGCELTCAVVYNDCVNEADREFEGSLLTLPTLSSDEARQRWTDNALQSHDSTVGLCSARYAICGLLCLLPF